MFKTLFLNILELAQGEPWILFWFLEASRNSKNTFNCVNYLFFGLLKQNGSGPGRTLELIKCSYLQRRPPEFEQKHVFHNAFSGAAKRIEGLASLGIPHGPREGPGYVFFRAPKN